MNDMTPSEAREVLDSLAEDVLPPPGTPAFAVQFTFARALQTIASMHEEEDHGPIPFEKVDGRYENYHRVRYFTDWRDK